MTAPGGARRVRLPADLDLAACLEGFRRWGDDLVDRWDGRRWARATPSPFAATSAGPRTLAVQDPGGRFALRDHLVLVPLGDLVEADPVVAEADRMHPGVRTVLQPDPLTALVRSISAQQVNLKWACTTRRRLVEAFGRPHEVGGTEVWAFDAAKLAAADPAAIRALQFTTRKAEYLVAVGRAAAEGRLQRDRFDAMDDDEVVAELVTLPGIGRWTADWFLARTLGRPAVVAGDLGVRKAIGAAYFEGRMPTEDEVRAATAHWGPAAGTAQQLLLHALSEGTLSAVVEAARAGRGRVRR